MEPMYPPTHLTHSDPNHTEKNYDKNKLVVMSKNVLESELRNECIFDESLTVAQSDLSPMDPSSTNQKNLRTNESRVPPYDNAKLHQSTMLRASRSSAAEIFNYSLTRSLFTHALAPSCSPFPWLDSKKI